MLAPPLSYHDLRRLVEIDDEEVHPKEEADDDLGEALVDACRDLETEERVGSSMVSVEPLQSVAARFDLGEPKALKPRCLLARHFEMGEGVSTRTCLLPERQMSPDSGSGASPQPALILFAGLNNRCSTDPRYDSAPSTGRTHHSLFYMYTAEMATEMAKNKSGLRKWRRG